METYIEYKIQRYSDTRSEWMDESQPFDDKADAISYLDYLRKEEPEALWQAVKITTTYEAIAA